MLKVHSKLKKKGRIKNYMERGEGVVIRREGNEGFWNACALTGN